ncbi:MAG: DUF2172 domain-containing protein [Elusimicrobia bacterium]|nr:DUF2172 domain-containing protein [Elusimicrobiota bacterium]
MPAPAERPAFHYDGAGLTAALRAVGLAEGDIAFTHVGLGMLGFPKEGPTEDAMYRVVRDAFLDILGPRGTLLVPTYSYSFCRGEEFDPETTPSTVGPFTERFRSEPGVLRSLEPVFSVAGLGPAAADLFAGLPKECFGRDCLYERLIRVGAKICNVGVGFRYATFVHHIEQREAVPYRYPKRFPGWLRRGGRRVHEEWLYNVRALVGNSYPDLRRLESDAWAKSGFRRARVGRSEATLVTCPDMDRFCTEGIRRDPWYLARGPAVDVAEEELSARGSPVPGRGVVSLAPDAGPHAILAALSPLPAQPLAPACETTLKALCAGLPSRTLSTPTGTRVGGALVPERWICRDASLARADGGVLLSLSSQPLLASFYSAACDTTLDLAGLRARLRTHPLRGAVPYAAETDHLGWSLCCSADTAERLQPGRYRVRIDSAHLYGRMSVTEVLAEGGTDDVIALSVRTDHCGLADDALSGAVAAACALRRRLAGAPGGQSLLLLLSSGPLGPAWWFRARPELSKRVRAVIAVHGMGRGDTPVLQSPVPSEGRWPAAVAAAMKRGAPALREVRGESAWLCAADLASLPEGLPVYCLNRAPEPLDREAPYPGFRTSLDSPDRVLPSRLQDSVDLLGRFFSGLDAAARP